MSLLDRLTRSAPTEAFPAQQTFGSLPFSLGRPTTAGTNVTVDSAVELIPVYSAVNLISSAIGSLPCKVYADRQPRTEARSSRQWRLLHDQPNEDIAADEFWQWVTACLLLWGNAFIYKQRDANGVVQQLWPIRPSRVMVGREPLQDGTSRRYFVLDGSGKFYDVDILHIRGLGTDGLVGYSPVQIARQQLANDIAQQEFLGTFMKNGLFSSAVFTHPNRLSKEAQDRLRAQIENRSGWLAAGQTITLEEGADLKNLTMSLVDAEFVTLQKLSEHRVAQIYGLVPPHQWGAIDQAKSMTYQNSEFGGLEFVKWTLRPWLVRLEASVARDQGIFPAPGPILFPEFLVDALLRADTAARWTAYSLGFGKWINAEWIQQTENIALPEGTEIMPVAAADQPADGADATDMGGPGGGQDGRQLVLGQRVLPAADSRAVAGVLDELRQLFRPEIRVDSPVTVLPPTQLPPDVVVNEADHSDALDAMTAAIDRLGEIVSGKDLSVTVDAPAVTVNVPEQPAPVVTVTLADEDSEPEQLEIDFVRNPNGTIKSATVR